MKHTSAYKSVIQYALDNGLSVTVSWETEIDLDKSTDFHEIVDAVEATDSPVVTFFKGGEIKGAVMVIVELDDKEQVADFTPTPFIDEWFDKFIDGEL